MQIFSTFHNDNILKALESIFPDVSFVEDEQLIQDSDLLLLAAKTSQFGVDPQKIRGYLDQATEQDTPAIIIVSDGYAAGRDLIGYAKERIPAENILIPVNKVIPRETLLSAINSTALAGEYKIDLDGIPETPPAPDIIVMGEIRGDEEMQEVQKVIRESQAPRSLRLPLTPLAVYGVKGGVGASTVAAMITGTLANAVHVEVVGPGGIPSAWIYYGQSAKRTGSYVCWDCSEDFPEVHGIPVLDISQSVPVSIVDEILAQAACLVLVADRSETSFCLVGDLCKGGFACDLFVVNSTFMAVGNTVDTYKGEFSDLLPEDLVDIPGGLDVEQVILKAQRDHVSPVSVAGAEDLTMAAGEIVSAIRKKMSM